MPPTQMIAENSIPNFLLKLWKLVEDAQYRQCIRWDDTGFSFHVREPYTFSKGILPLYFKHSNLNSFIRQLNMYGFRKVTNLDKGSLKQNADQHDSLEFQHPYFVRGHAELLQYIKRKVSNNMKSCAEVIEPTQQQNNGVQNGLTMNGSCQSSGSIPAAIESGSELNHILGDVRLLRDKQMAMDAKLNQIKKENQALWREVGRMRQLHMKQQQIVNKLIQLLLSLVQPGSGTGQRLGKRQLLPIGGSAAMMNQQELEGIAKRLRTNGVNGEIESTNQIIESLQESERNGNPNANLIISDVTDEFESDSAQCHQYHQQKRSSMDHGHMNGVSPQSPRVNQIEVGDDRTRTYQQNQHLNSLHRSPMVVPASNCVVVSRHNAITVSSDSDWDSSDNSSPVNQPEFSEYLDFVQSDLDSLKTLLASESLNMDQDSLNNLFTMADETNNMLATAAQQMKDAQHDYTMNADIIGNEMQLYKPPEVLLPPSNGMKPQLKSPQKNNSNQTNESKQISMPQPVQALLTPLHPLLPPLPPPPPSFHFFQRQASVPAYYGGQNYSQMPNHYNFVQQTNNSNNRFIYTNCAPQNQIQNPQNGFCRLAPIGTPAEDMDESNMILNQLFSSDDQSGYGDEHASSSGVMKPDDQVYSPNSLSRGRRRTSID